MALSDNVKGALLMMGAMAGFTLNDTLIKLLSTDLPLNQILFLRGIFTSLGIAGLALVFRGFRGRFTAKDRWLIALRIVGEVGAAYFFLTALFNMPLANVTAILQSLPLAVTLAAAVFLREPVGWRRVLAIIAGFIGVMLIVRPGTEGFSLYSLYALIAVGFVTLRDLVTRQLSAEVPSLFVTLITSLSVMTSFGLASLGTDWVAMDTRHWGLLLGASAFIIVGYTFSVMVMRVGEIGVIAPFRYTGLLWALMLGFVVFGDWPVPLTLLGAAIIVASGIFTLLREARVRRGTAPRQPLRPR